MKKMSDKSFFNKLNSFWLKLKRQGFTLTEALIITIMTGYCLLPILDTMQNAQTRTQNYDHQSKMQLYSRSRLNAEIANSAFDHTAINIEDEYHYIVFYNNDTSNPNPDPDDMNQAVELPKTTIATSSLLSINDEDKTKWDDQAISLLGIDKNSTKVPHITIVHAYKTSVEIKEQPTLEYISSDGTPQSLDSPKALLGIVVKTCLIESNGDVYRESDGALGIKNNDYRPGVVGSQEYIYEENEKVPPVTLFSFVNLPTVGDEMIWLADAYNWKIYGIDPFSKTISTTIKLIENLPEKDEDKNNFRPWHLAIHPSLKILAYETDKYLFLLNIDRKSSHYKETIIGSTKGFTQYAKYGGITFRPDGKCLFIVAKNTQDQGGENQLIPLKVTYSIDPNTKILNWVTSGANKTPKLETLISTNRDLDTEKISGFVAANDGYLYVAQEDEKNILRFPMYPSKWSDWDKQKFIETNHEINSIDVSPDGNQIAVVTNKEKLSIYDTRTGREIYEDKPIKSNSDFKVPFKATFINYSSSSLNFSDTRSLTVAVTNKDTANNKDFTNYFYGLDTPVSFRKLHNKIKDKIRGSNVLLSPDNNSIVINDLKKARVYISKTGVDDSEDEYTSSSDERIIKYRKIQSFDDDNSEEEGSDDINDYSTQITTSKRDILAVVAGSDNKTVQLYDLNTNNALEEGNFKTNSSITSLAMNPQGNTLVAGHGVEASGGTAGESGSQYWFGQTSSNGYTRFFLTDFSSIYSDGGYFKNFVFDDRTPNMAFGLEYRNQQSNEDNAFWNIDHHVGNGGDYWEFPEDTPYDRRDLDFSKYWRRFDMIGMPRGGAMVLYGKPDGSSMLEWIGRRNWEQDDTNKGKYRLFARWTNLPEKTPFPSTMPDFTTTETDGGQGTVVRSRTAIPEGTKYDSVSLITGTWSSTSKRFITPLIIQYSTHWTLSIPSIPYTAGTVIDYAKSLELEQDKTYFDLPLNWKNGGVAQSNCAIAFWNGKVGGSKNAGVVKFDRIRNDTCKFYADIYESVGLTGALDKDTFDNYSQLESAEFDGDCKNGNDSKRDYAIQFKCSSLSQFPPLFSKKLAISPDCGTLAILAGEENSKSSLNLFDFNNQIYGPETQIEGMLVDCREPKAKACSNWPYETGDTSLFDNVNSRSHFNEGKVNTFSKATTNNDYYWSTFNQYPANFYASSLTNVNYNKRYFSYLRSEFEIKKFQCIFSEEIRFFYNSNFLYGRNYSNSVITIPDPLEFNSKAYETNLLQIDQSVDGSSIDLAPFITSETSPGDLPTNKHTDNYYYSNNDKWKPIKSDQTYILNNYPSFIGAFDPVKSGSDYIDIDSTSMLFSRDKSRPVLFLSDKDFLWTFYKQTLLKTYGNVTSSLNNSTNHVLSTDGQRLLIGDTSKKINSYDVSTPDDSVFNTQTKSIKSLKIGQLSKDYLNLSDSSISLDSIPKYLATKPYNSYKSSASGGTYNPAISIIDAFEIGPNSIAVASGGIYILKNNSKDIGIYNPLISPDSITIKSDALNKNTCGSSLTSYDNTLYMFGNGGAPRSARVQSYNVNNGIALNSLDEASYNIVTPPKTVTYHHTADNYLEWYDNEGNLVHIHTADSNGTYALYQVYTGNTIDSNGNVSGSQGWEPNSPSGGIQNPWIRITFQTPKVINCIKYANSNNSNKLKVNKFRVYGAVTSDAPGISNGNLPPTGSDWQPINFSSTGTGEFTGEQTANKLITAELLNTQAYKHYLFQLNSFANTETKNLRLVAFQFLEMTSSSSSPTSDYLTLMKTDTLEDFKTDQGAACSTPYGLVTSGGCVGEDGPDYASNKALLYWPHAINKYDGNYREFGISRSLPDMDKKRANHALVWHKGKIYAIGGRSGLKDPDIYGPADFIEFLDYNSEMKWKKYPTPFKYVDGASEDIKRYNHGACSFGDEIFIFGGMSSSTHSRSSAIAFNPETGVIRLLTDMDEALGSSKLNPCVAVPFGSKIYIMGNDSNDSQKLKIIEYTP